MTRSPPKLRAVAVDASELLRGYDQQATEKVLHNVTCHAFDCQRAYGWMGNGEGRDGRQMKGAGTATAAATTGVCDCTSPPLERQREASTASRGIISSSRGSSLPQRCSWGAQSEGSGAAAPCLQCNASAAECAV